MNVRLLSACPADALRPHFQEGYLVGSFPIRSEKKQPQLDFARRLVAKIEIPKKGFWGRDFDAIRITHSIRQMMIFAISAKKFVSNTPCELRSNGVSARGCPQAILR